MAAMRSRRADVAGRVRVHAAAATAPPQRTERQHLKFSAIAPLALNRHEPSRRSAEARAAQAGQGQSARPRGRVTMSGGLR
ncbi:hypothetical protein BN2475_480003 [Paraburkholderia ribeironis]|uniref:Uncharacterized protein n=1 Tax=Paraburkholderia ribeironis TaxID=1247936 RepID=A0A1N7SB48_9BURK|nr:hypothetical protein BN2475_480003 [Paraburkholderia ribeironis]